MGFGVCDSSYIDPVSPVLDTVSINGRMKPLEINDLRRTLEQTPALLQQDSVFSKTYVTDSSKGGNQTITIVESPSNGTSTLKQPTISLPTFYGLTPIIHRRDSKLKQTNTGIDFYLAVVAAREKLMVYYRCDDTLVTRALRTELDAQNLKNDVAFVEHTREPDSRTQLSMQFELWYRKKEREHTTITSADIVNMLKSMYISNDVIQSLKIKLTDVCQAKEW